MTEILQHTVPSGDPVEPAGPPAAGSRQPRRPLVAGAAAASVAAALGLLALAAVVLGGWAAERGSASAGNALRAAASLWLAAHGTALEAPSGRFALTPLGLTALPLVLLWRAGRAVAVESRAASVPAALRSALTVTAPYAALVGAVALACGTPVVAPDPVSALLGGALVALAGAGAGALAPHRRARTTWLRRGPGTRRSLTAAACALAALVAAGALLVAASLAVHLGRAADLAAATAPGPAGATALLLLGLAYVPTAVVWGLCWWAGPGFAVGTGTSVGPFATELGAVPSLPLLAALPTEGTLPEIGVLALLVPLAAGALAGAVLHRAAPGASRSRALLDVVLTACWCAAACAGLAWLTAGPVGGQRLAEVGPSAGSVGLAVAAEVGVGALLALLVLRRRVRP